MLKLRSGIVGQGSRGLSGGYLLEGVSCAIAKVGKKPGEEGGYYVGDNTPEVGSSTGSWAGGCGGTWAELWTRPGMVHSRMREDAWNSMTVSCGVGLVGIANLGVGEQYG